MPADFNPWVKLGDTYNEDLELVVVVAGNFEGEGDDEDDGGEGAGEIGADRTRFVLRGVSLLDSVDCRTLRKIPLPASPDCQRNANLFSVSLDLDLDLDVLAVKLKPMEGTPKLYLFRLVEDDVEEEEVVEETEPGKKSPRKRKSSAQEDGTTHKRRKGGRRGSMT